MKIHETTEAVVATLRSELAGTASGLPVLLGKKFLVRREKGAAIVAPSSWVVIVPTTAAYRLAEYDDGEHVDGPIVMTAKQRLEVHVWAAAADAGEADQYAADLALAQRVMAKVWAAMLKRIPGAAVGGDGPIVEAGENVRGVEIVATMTADLSLRDAPLELAPADWAFELTGEGVGGGSCSDT